MKFGRYLKDNQTPEWKRVYIDYSACKKKIKAIGRRLGQDKDVKETEGEKDSSDGDDEDHGPSKQPSSVRSPSIRAEAGRTGSLRSPKGSDGTPTPGIGGTPLVGGSSRSRGFSSPLAQKVTSPRPIHRRPSPPPPLDIGESSYPKDADPVLNANPKNGEPSRRAVFSVPGDHRPDASDDPSSVTSDHIGEETSDSGRMLTSPKSFKTKAKHLHSPKFSKSPRFARSPRMGASIKSPALRSLGSLRRSPRSLHPDSPHPSSKLYQTFDEIYNNLDDDEKDFFDFLDHELEKVETFYDAREAEAVQRAKILSDQLIELAEHRKHYYEIYPKGLPTSHAVELVRAADKLHLRVPFAHHNEEHAGPPGTRPFVGASKNGPPSGAVGDVAETPNHDHSAYDPERYQQYKKEIRLALQDFYRHLERIKNYRILNLTGFRKALKKFEKVTKIHVMEMYTDEKISKKSFANGKVIEKLLDQIEREYTNYIEHGDSKKARDRLRRNTTEKTHYAAIFRSALYIGLGLPAAIFALVQARQAETQRAIPAWEGLLQVYGALFIVVIFAMLIELNLLAYVEARINYEFVMELQKPTLDHRSYLEIPSFLFLTLSYCMFFSFYRVGASNVSPTTWPAAWFVMVAVFLLNPVDIIRRGPRWWFLRVLFRVFTPGYSRVEFIAFFIADELNSLLYTLENIYFMFCAYANSWPRNVFAVCPVGAQWPYAIILAIPPLCRFIQCIKRWLDSGLAIHLINAGKYLSVIVQYSLFVGWRSRGSGFQDPVFIVWIIFAAIAAAYTSSWDLIVDWSLFRPNSRLLRHDRGYRSTYVYYFAIVTNLLVRWEFIWYLPVPGRAVRLRTFFLALAEMLRRWQWNFFRVETEHLGNADAYRVTREIPLPYRKAESDEEEDVGGVVSEQNRKSVMSVRLQKLKRELLGSDRKGFGPDELNVGPRGHAGQREYEAGRRWIPPEAESGDISEV